MARQTEVVQSASRTGLNPAYAAAHADGAKFVNDGKTLFHMVNGGGSPVVATIQTPVTVDDGLTVQDPTVSIPAGETRVIGALKPSTYNQTSTDAGSVYVDFDGVTSLTVAAIKNA